MNLCAVLCRVVEENTQILFQQNGEFTYCLLKFDKQHFYHLCQKKNTIHLRNRSSVLSFKHLELLELDGPCKERGDIMPRLLIDRHC